MIHVEPEYRVHFPERSVEEFFAIPGETAKAIQNRVTRRFERDGRVFFIKCHEGIGWGEVLKNLLSLRLPVISAANEWRAIQRLGELGVDTMRGVAFGEEGTAPAGILSFLVTESLEHTVDLESWGREFQASPQDPRRLSIWRALIRRVGETTGRLHHNGVNHRDYYLCHLRLDLGDGETSTDPAQATLYVMDLHRAQMRPSTPSRWAVKDLAGLLYSALHGPAALRLSRADLARFLRGYLGPAWKQDLRDRRSFWKQVVRRYRGYCAKDRQTAAKLLG